MSKGLYRGIMFGLVAGLMIGFVGGRQTQNLDAQAPLGSSSEIASDAVLSQSYRIIFRDAVKTAVNENGLDAVFGTKPSGVTHNSENLFNSTLLTPFIGTALAQNSGECSGAELDLIERAWKSSFDYQGDDNECIESYSLQGTLSYSLYAGIKGDIDEGGFLYNKIVINFKGIATTIGWRTGKDGKCSRIVHQIAIEFDEIIYWDGSGVIEPDGDAEWSSINWWLICEGSDKIDWTWKNPKFDKDACCKEAEEKEVL